jgi:hypothetical protein
VVATESSAERVRVVWLTSDTDEAVLYRRAPGGAWEGLARLRPDGSHRVAYEDFDVTPGATYGYRLGILVQGTEGFFGETHVTVPAAAAELELSGIALDGDRLMLTLTTPEAGGGTLEVFDAGGRRTLEHRFDGLAAGPQRVEVPRASLRAGVYFARLVLGGRVASRRFVVVR